MGSQDLAYGWSVTDVMVSIRALGTAGFKSSATSNYGAADMASALGLGASDDTLGGFSTSV